MPKEIKENPEKKASHPEVKEEPKVIIQRGLWRISFTTGKMEKIE